MLGFSMAKVVGNSMWPDIPANSFVLFRRVKRFDDLTEGDVVRVEHPLYGETIKQISRLCDGNQILLQGTNSDSVTPKQLGMVCFSRIRGRCIYVVPPRH